ncbi:MAG: DNA-binding domain-containing protein [Planctomycetes bacterium]|nr:DNA-binding domain-containing protein [Planctomycetota bacterium]
MITHPDGVLEGARSAEAQQQIAVPPDELEQIIERSRNQTSVERLAVYANAYYARLIECLEEEFSAMAFVLGEETFRAFAFEYLQRYPPGSYTLAKLAANFPRFLRKTRPVEDAHDEGTANWTDFLIDLATLERTYSEVFDSPGAEGNGTLQRDELAAISPERWPAARLLPVACLRLLELQFPVHEFAAAVKHGQEPVIPLPSATYLVVSRRNLVVHPRAVSRLEFEMLEGLCEGYSVGEVVSMASESCESEIEQLSTQLRDWFESWSADGLFMAVATTD